MPTPGGRAADLGELEALGAEEPLHVRRRVAQRQRVDDVARHLAQLAVAVLLDAVRHRDLRRDGTLAARLEAAGEVVRREVVPHARVVGDRVEEALVPFDELLDRRRRRRRRS